MAAAERKEIIRQPIASLFKAITDFEAYPQFVNGMRSAKILSNGGTKKKVSFDLEMMKRLQYVVEVNSEMAPSAQEATVSWTLVESSFFKVNNGWWFLKAVSPNETEVIYKIELDFSFPVPGFVLKGLISNTLPAAIRDFSKRAEQLQV
jgi:ribosome-associated toxin RatA of RatAB toxin-antitoxin module